MSDDIVARLRVYANARMEGGLATVFRADLHAAADEIERLRELSGDAGKLRAERDEARREVCEWVAMMTRQKPSTAAKQRGWDCFKNKDVEEWRMERVRDAIDKLPSFPLCKEAKQ